MLIGHLGLDFNDDFYPDDLPQEWQFDYYCNEFNCLFLEETAQIDMSELLEDIEDDFCLVLAVNQQNLKCQHPNIVFWTQSYDAVKNLDNQPNICIQSDKKLDIDLNFVQIENQFLYFNNKAVFMTTLNSNDKELAQQLKQLPQDICVIFQKTNSVNLQKAKTISELLDI